MDVQERALEEALQQPKPHANNLQFGGGRFCDSMHWCLSYIIDLSYSGVYVSSQYDEEQAHKSLI